MKDAVGLEEKFGVKGRKVGVTERFFGYFLFDFLKLGLWGKGIRGRRMEKKENTRKPSPPKQKEKQKEKTQ